jgi:hypothetical protein
VPFGQGVGIGDDAAAGLDVGGLVFDEDRADGDVQAEVKVGADPADGAGVDAAGDGLQFVDDFHGADLGGAGDGAAGEGGFEDFNMTRSGDGGSFSFPSTTPAAW